MLLPLISLGAETTTIAKNTTRSSKAYKQVNAGNFCKNKRNKMNLQNATGVTGLVKSETKLK